MTSYTWTDSSGNEITGHSTAGGLDITPDTTQEEIDQWEEDSGEDWSWADEIDWSQYGL